MLHRIAQTHPVQVAKPQIAKPRVEQVVPKTASQLNAIKNGYLPSNPPRPTAQPKDTFKVPGGTHPITRTDY